MTKPFLRVCSPEAAREILRIFGPLGEVEVDLAGCSFRVTSRPVTAQEDLPAFNRSTMDGFAVRAADTFGSGEGAPALFTVVGEVAMGEIPNVAPGRQETVRIWTGGALPQNTDAVVMVEHTRELGQDTVEIMKAVAPFDNVVRTGEDFKRDETLLPAGHRLRPQDIGILAAMGRLRAHVFHQPRVAVLSSGDEIVPVEQVPSPGCMRDVNRHTITAAIRDAHAIPIWIGIVPDGLQAVSEALARGIHQADLVVISGGSSMGSRDLVIEAINSSPEGRVLIHGVAVSPGKPLIVAKVGACPVVGLPGHPVSALLCFDQFVVPLLRRLEGEDAAGPYFNGYLGEERAVQGRSDRFHPGATRRIWRARRPAATIDRRDRRPCRFISDPTGGACPRKVGDDLRHGARPWVHSGPDGLRRHVQRRSSNGAPFCRLAGRRT